jgi:hypothetical protein
LSRELDNGTVLAYTEKRAPDSPMIDNIVEEGAKLLNTIQDVYLCKEITIA